VSAGDLVCDRPPVLKVRLLPREQWVDDWFKTSVDQSLKDFKVDTAEVSHGSSLGPPVAFLA